MKLMCPYTHPHELVGVCYEDCQPGYSGFTASCMKDCKSGWKAVGASCNRWNSNFNCKWCHHWGIPYPCCSGGWEVEVRHTKSRAAKEMMVAFSINSGLENVFKSVLADNTVYIDDIMKDFAKKVAQDGSFADFKDRTRNEYWLEHISIGFRSRLKDAYAGLRGYNIDWVQQAVGTAFAFYDEMKDIGRRRLELHGAGEHPSQTGKPVVLIDEEDEFVEELADGTLEVLITRERLDDNLMKMLNKEVGKGLRAKGKSEEEVDTALNKLAAGLKDALFVEEEGKSGDMTIEEYFGEDGGDRAEAVSGRLVEEEEDSNGAAEDSAERRRRLAGSSIATCENSALMVTMGSELSLGAITGFAGMGGGFSTCGAGFYGTAGVGAYAMEKAGVEVFIAFDLYLKGKYIAGAGSMMQFGFDIPTGPGEEPFGMEMQLLMNEEMSQVTGFGVTVSAGLGFSPISVTPYAATWTHQF